MLHCFQHIRYLSILCDNNILRICFWLFANGFVLLSLLTIARYVCPAGIVISGMPRLFLKISKEIDIEVDHSNL